MLHPQTGFQHLQEYTLHSSVLCWTWICVPPHFEDSNSPTCKCHPPIVAVYNRTVGFLRSTVATKMAGMKLKYFVCFFCTGHHFDKVLRLVSLAPADVVQVSIWCLNVISDLLWVLLQQVTIVFWSRHGMHPYPYPEWASSSLNYLLFFAGWPLRIPVKERQIQHLAHFGIRCYQSLSLSNRKSKLLKNPNQTYIDHSTHLIIILVFYICA